jgi:hypothetical protein
MSTRWLAAFTLIATLSLVPPTLMAEEGQHKGQGNPHASRSGDNDDDDRWERRDGYEYRSYGDRDGRPPGWRHGKKTGWGDCGLPLARQRSTAAALTSTRGVPTTIIRTNAGESSSVFRSLSFTGAWISTDFLSIWA